MKALTGPEHYAEAVRLLAQTNDYGPDTLAIIAKAQVHATLALVMVTADKS